MTTLDSYDRRSYGRSDLASLSMQDDHGWLSGLRDLLIGAVTFLAFLCFAFAALYLRLRLALPI